MKYLHLQGHFNFDTMTLADLKTYTEFLQTLLIMILRNEPEENFDYWIKYFASLEQKVKSCETKLTIKDK